MCGNNRCLSLVSISIGCGLVLVVLLVTAYFIAEVIEVNSVLRDFSRYPVTNALNPEAIEKLGQPDKAMKRLHRYLILARWVTPDSWDDNRLTAVQLLAHYGKPAVPTLVQLLADTNWRVRAAAAESLGEIGPEATTAIPGLIVAFDDREVIVRWKIAWAFGCIRPTPREAVAALIRGLSDTSESVREEAADALAEIGPAARETAPALVRALGDRSAGVRASSAWALLRICSPVPSAAAQLKRLLSDTSPLVRVSAAGAIWKIEGEKDLAYPILLAGFDNADEDVRARSAKVLKEIGPASREMLRKLILLAVSDESSNVRFTAYEVVREMKKANPSLDVSPLHVPLRDE